MSKTYITINLSFDCMGDAINRLGSDFHVLRAYPVPPTTIALLEGRESNHRIPESTKQTVITERAHERTGGRTKERIEWRRTKH